MATDIHTYIHTFIYTFIQTDRQTDGHEWCASTYSMKFRPSRPAPQPPWLSPHSPSPWAPSLLHLGGVVGVGVAVNWWGTSKYNYTTSWPRPQVGPGDCAMYVTCHPIMYTVQRMYVHVHVPYNMHKLIPFPSCLNTMDRFLRDSLCLTCKVHNYMIAYTIHKTKHE